LNPLSAVYGRVTGLRRGWYARHPEKRRRLDRPVISVGNLVAGGSGKTPVVAAIAEMLRRAGERPAILSRGYGRRSPDGDVVVVSDGTRTLEPVERSGDEPQMLARALRQVPVLVASDRHRAGQLARSRFDSTVLLLDDGFQHLQLARDVDLLIVSPEDLEERMLPAGTLREPLASAQVADALLVPASGDAVARVGAALGVSPVFTVTTTYDEVRLIGSGETVDRSAPRRVMAVAAIARPARFVNALRDRGWDVVSQLTFRDHHWFSERDLARVAEMARTSGAELVITTEKDAARLRDVPATPVWAVLPMHVSIEPGAAFTTWLTGRLVASRAAAGDAPTGDGQGRR
jgi:tetraacyldisaccharide 4'-kinase